MITRVITALIALPIVIAVVFVGNLWFAGGVLVFALIAGWEFDRMMKVGGYGTNLILISGLIALLILDQVQSNLSLSCIITAALLISLIVQLFQTSETPTADWALTIAGGLYIGWGMAHLIALRQLADGLAWIWLALLSTWAADTFAYFAGKALGRTKLWPRHSPKKTWEGLFGGIIGGILGAVVIALVSNLSLANALVIGSIIPIVALFGDLAISMMKRHVQVKDSSNLFPGHGGFLDRLDSILFVSVVVYQYAIWSGLLGLSGVWNISLF
ncbi:MAG: phosphatidate cytidylyltransferase [Chloroflexota bacterium]